MTARIQGGVCTLAVLIVLALVGVASGRAWGAETKPSLVHFEIPEGDFAERLLQFADQAQMSVLYEYDGKERLTTHAVNGDFTPRDAVERMLKGLGFRVYVQSRSVTLRRLGPTDGDIASGRGNDRVTRTLTPRAPGVSAGESERKPIVISTGRLHRNEIERPLGMGSILLDRTDIDQSGLASTAAVLKTVPQVFGGGPSEDTHQIGLEAPTNTARGYGVNIRGLGAGSVLALMDGHRLAPSGQEGSFVDVSSIPLPAVKAMQIFPESATVRYGGDSVGGAVNFAMWDEFEGALTTGQFGSTTKGDLQESAASQIFGGHTSFGHGLIAVDFYKRTSLAASRRAQVTGDLTPFGGNNFNLPLGSPGTLFAGGIPYAIHPNPDGHLDPVTLVPGTRNDFDQWRGSDVLPDQQRWSAFGTWQNELTDSLAISADVLTSHREVESFGSPFAALLPIPPSNPFIPAGLAPGPLLVGYNFGTELGRQRGEGSVKTSNGIIGLDWTLSPQWKLTGSAQYASERLDFEQRNSLDRTQLALALVNPDPLTALNVFSDGRHTNPATIEKLRTTTFFDSNSMLKSLNVVADGELGHWKSGPMKVAAGAEYRESYFSSGLRQTPTAVPITSGGDRSVKALFAEARLPLWGKDRRAPGLERLELSAAARFEEYSDFGRSVTPRYAIEWAPSRTLTLHASSSRSFRAPSLVDLAENNNALTPFVLPDPSSSTGRTLALIWSGKNSDLREETARSWTAGITFESLTAPGLILAATYFDIKFTNRINPPPGTLLNIVLTDPHLASMVTRNPSREQLTDVCRRAPISAFPIDCNAIAADVLVDFRLRNDASLYTRGVDVSGSYAFDTSLGTFALKLNGNYVMDFSDAKVPGAPLVDRVSTPSYPIDLRLRGSVGWERGGFNVVTFLNFADHYRDNASIPPRKVNSWTTLDMTATYTLSSGVDERRGETSFALAAQNLFDHDPPFLNNVVGVGYDQENADIIGRMVSFTIRHRW